MGKEVRPQKTHARTAIIDSDGHDDLRDIAIDGGTRKGGAAIKEDNGDVTIKDGNCNGKGSIKDGKDQRGATINNCNFHTKGGAEIGHNSDGYGHGGVTLDEGVGQGDHVLESGNGDAHTKDGNWERTCRH
jgi:hypothetical protein